MALAALAPAQAHAGVFVVNNGNDWDSNGTCDSVSCTARDAADAVRASTDPFDEIVIPVTSNILYRIGIDDNNTAGDIDLCKPVTGGEVLIRGVGSPSVFWDIATQFEYRDRIFHVPESTAECFTVDLRIENVTMGRGKVYDQADGGGCVASHGNLLELHEAAMYKCWTTNTTGWGPAVPGGGAVQAHGQLIMTQSIARDNEAIGTNGGAIQALGDLTLDSVKIFDNQATAIGGDLARGGGVHVPDLTAVTILSSEIHDNTARGQGGGLWLAPSQLSIVDTEVFDNEVTLGTGAGGGGLFLLNPEDQGSDPIIERSLFADNRAATTNARGGGIFFAGAANDPLRVHNTTFSGNEGNFGGALFVGTEDMTVEVHHGTFHLNMAGNNDDVARVEGSATLTYEASLVNGRCNGGGTVTTVGYSVVRDFGGGPNCPFDLGVGDEGPWLGLMFFTLGTPDGGSTRYHKPTGDTEVHADNVPLASCLTEDQRAAARPDSGTVCFAGSVEVP